MINNLIPLIFFTTFLFYTSCGGKVSKSETTLNFSVGSIVNGTPMDGGITMVGTRYDEFGEISEIIKIDLPEDHLVSIPKGIWDLYFVGYSGPGPWNGTNYCGGSTGKSLINEEEILEIIINQTNCSSEPYITIIANKEAVGSTIWDSAIWDADKWGP